MITNTRAGKIAQYKNGNVWHPDYMHADYLEYYLRDFVKDGSCLNMCCGFSELGQVRADITPESTRTIEADLFNPLATFRENEFAYVYADPPFNAYTSGTNRFQWQFDLFKIARIALITRRPRVGINMPSKRHTYWICEDSRPSITLIRIDYK